MAHFFKECRSQSGLKKCHQKTLRPCTNKFAGKKTGDRKKERKRKRERKKESQLKIGNEQRTRGGQANAGIKRYRVRWKYEI